MTQLLPSGVEIATNIKQRCRDLRQKGVKLTVKRVFAEAGLSYLTYKSWMGGRAEPRRKTVQKVEAVLVGYETRQTGGVDRSPSGDYAA